MVTSSFTRFPLPRVTTLFVSRLDSEHAALRRIFSRSNWKLKSACSCEEALSLLHRESIPVIICDCDLPDGNWRTLLERIETIEQAPRVIVSSREVNEELWASVLQMGGYDLLAIPWEAREVLRAIALAWRSWELACPTTRRPIASADKLSRAAAVNAIAG